MKRILFLILVTVVMIGCQSIDRLDDLQAKIDSLQIKNDSLLHLLGEQKVEVNFWYDAKYDGEKLIRRGVENPEEFVKNSLREKAGLIPIKGVLGGTMNFGNVQLLGSEWAIASFDDGHIEGKAIYTYKLNEQGEVEFKLLSSMLP